MLFGRRVVPGIAVIIALVIGAALAAHGDTSTATVQPRTRAGAAGRAHAKRPAGQVYVVQPGECLERIARRHGITTQALAKANGLDPDRMLLAGQYLTIPAAAASPPEAKPQPRWYTVKKSDSLWRLAKRFGTTPGAIASANGLRPTAKLLIGQRLRISDQAKVQVGAAASSNSSLVETALEYRGVRYRYGGITTRGMDCSGLVYRVLNTHGISAPHNSRALYRLGKSVARKDLEAGDLVFFHTRGRGISHVGIYIGDGKFVHASSGKGRVRVDRLDEGYYARRYVGARRVS